MLSETLHRLDAIHKDEHDTYPNWITKVSFHWLQAFPAGKRVAVRHRYRPIYGSFHNRAYEPSAKVTRNDRKLGGQWCFDQGFNSAEMRLLDRNYEAAVKDKSIDPDVQYENIQYVLKTGANWHGPIGHFLNCRLTKAARTSSRPVRFRVCSSSARLTVFARLHTIISR